jgi:hypothetical protein
MTQKRNALLGDTRFCDKWLGAHHTAEEARAACAEYDESRWLVQA